MGVSFSGRSMDFLVSFADQADNFVELNAQVGGFDEQRIGALPQHFQFFAPGEGGGGFGNVGTRAVTFGDDAGAFEFEIGAGDRVGIDHEFLGEDADGGDFLARGEPAAGDELFDLIHDLDVDRDAVVGADMNLHGYYSDRV